MRYNYVQGGHLLQKKPSIAEKVAKVLSFALHPFLIAPLAVVLLLYLDTSDLLVALAWSGVCVFFCTVPLVVYLAYKVMTKQYTDVDVSLREQRQGIYMFGAGCMAVCFGVLRWLDAPDVILYMFGGAFVTVVAFTLITRFWTKISAHTGGMAGITVVAAFYSHPWGIVLAGVTLLVAWARLVLKRHTLGQIVLGISVSGGIFLLTMLLEQ